MGVLSLWVSLSSYTPAPKWFLIPDLSMNNVSTLRLAVLPCRHQSSLVSVLYTVVQIDTS